jgi:hypothetical protein
MDETITIWRVEGPDYRSWVCDKRQLWKIRASSPAPLKIKRYETTREIWDALCERHSSRLHS